MKKEIWKPVVGHSGYEVSDKGRVRSRRGVLKPWRLCNGYLMTALGRDTKRSVHSLVAEAFLGPRPEGRQVRHLDGTKGNNRADNLCYGTAADNAADRKRHGNDLMGERHPMSRLNGKQVRAIRNDRRLLREVAADYGVHISTISLIRLGKTWAHV